ncbi:MAG: hypothetical protein HOY78_48070, partial [Saccharothrix sp.]|nr:hypothetical protein [Saccharothrix sp.]
PAASEPASGPAAQPPVAEPEPRPAPPRTVHNEYRGNNNVGPVIQVGYLHGTMNPGDSVNQNATAHDGGTVYQAGRDVRLDRDR